MTESAFKWTKHGSVMIGVNTPGKISDDVWSTFMADFSAGDYEYYLGCSLGILEVSSIQRKAAAVAMRENNVSVVVVTDEVLVRGIVTAVSWLGANVKSFPWREFDRALQYAELDSRKAEIVAHVDRLREEVTAIEEEQRRKRREQLRGLSDPP